MWIRARATSDPAAARAALAEIDDLSIYRLSRRRLVEGWAASGEPGLWRFLAELPAGGARREMAGDAVRRRLLRDAAPPLLREFEALPDAPPMGPLKGELLAVALDAVARDDLETAVSRAETQREAPWAGPLLARVALRWADRDGAAALAWLRRQPAAAWRGPALARTYRRWFAREADAARAWLDDRLDDPDLAPVLVAHASALAERDPDTAAAWAGRIPSDAVRERAERAVQTGRHRRERDAERRAPRPGAGRGARPSA